MKEKDDVFSVVKKFYRSPGTKKSKLIFFPLFFGSVMAILGLLYDTSLPYLAKWFFSGALTGFFLIFLNELFTLLYKDNPTEEDFEPRHERNIVLFLPYQEVFDCCLQSLKLIDEAAIISEDHLNGLIKAETPLTAMSGACSIIFRLNPLSETGTEVILKVSTDGRFILFDMGNSLKKIDILEEYLRTYYNESHNFLPAEKIEKNVVFEEFKVKIPR